MFFVFILFLFIFIYLIFRSPYKLEKPRKLVYCYGDCNPIYRDFEWIHQCDEFKFYREPLTTCTSCLGIFGINNEKNCNCKQIHCRKCGQRFRLGLPITHKFNIDLPTWKWCKNCEEWHCINCFVEESSSSFPL